MYITFKYYQSFEVFYIYKTIPQLLITLNMTDIRGNNGYYCCYNETLIHSKQ